MIQRSLCPLISALSVLLSSTALHAKGLTIDDMLAMQRLSDPAVSPDGASVAFAVRETDLEADRGRFDVWLARVDGTKVERLTTHAENDTDPQWSPDGKAIFFLSKRSASSQVWKIAATGGEAVQVTRLPVDVNGYRVFPDGKRLIVSADVWPDASTLAESAKKDDGVKKSKVKARTFDHLLFRHWDEWEDGKYAHLFLWTPPELGGKTDDARDLTAGQTTDSPPHPFGGMEEVSIAPDGKTIAFTARVGGNDKAWTTNTDIFLADTAGNAKSIDLTIANKAYDNQPAFSPDGKSLALLAMTRPGYESDRPRIAIVDLATRKSRNLTESWDRTPESLTWSTDGKTIYAAADDTGNRGIFAVDVASGSVKKLVAKGTSSDPRPAGQRLVFLKDTLRQPTELYSMALDGSDVRAVTALNDERVKKITWGDYEQFSFTGAHNDTVHGFVMKPAGFAGKGKVPVALIIHGGPQGSMGDHFHYRWNPEVFAGRGYGVVFIDFHGSTGYGQRFTDAIRDDWGGAPYDDVMLGLDAALAKYPWLDADRAVALGASFGGYMINWIAGHTNRFKALVAHDGNLDERAAYFDTEELWFPEWEHGGTPWDNPYGYSKHNPVDFVKNWKTPMLVVHGGRDYRVVDTAGMSTFTALQRKGIPSRFLYFPNENHWVLAPLESKLWHDEVLGWIDRFTAAKR